MRKNIIEELGGERLVGHNHLIGFSEIGLDQRDVVGGKSYNLGMLSQAGLPVPSGYAISCDEHRDFLEKGDLSEELLKEVMKIKQDLGGRVAIRSSANVEDGSTLSMAGVFESVYLNETDGEEEVRRAIVGIYEQSRSREVFDFLALHGLSGEEVFMGITVQRLIEAEVSGVIYTGVDGDNLLVQYVEGFGNKLVDMETSGSALLYEQDLGVIKQSLNHLGEKIDGVLQELSVYSREIDGLFGGNQDIEFACADGEVFILQSRPNTTKIEGVSLVETPQDTLENAKRQFREMLAYDRERFGLPYAVYESGNYLELLPRSKEMDFGIFAYIFTGQGEQPGGIQIGRLLMGYQMAMETMGYAHYIGGKPYTSSTRGLANYYLGFPSASDYYPTLGVEYITRMHESAGENGYGHMDLYLQNPTLEDLEKRFPGKGAEYLKIADSFNANLASYADSYKDEYLGSRLPEAEEFITRMREVDLSALSNEEIVSYINLVLEHLRTSSCVDFVVAARLGFYYTATTRDLIKRFFGEDAAGADKIFAQLNQGLEGSMITESNLEIAKAATEEEAIEIGRRLVGHYSTKEMLEIRHPLLRDDEEKLVSYIRGIRSGDYAANVYEQREKQKKAKNQYLEQLSPEQALEFSRVVDAALTYMALRETVKYHFSREYALIREGLEMLQSRLGLASGDIYSLDPTELDDFVTDPSSFGHLIMARKQAFENYAQLDFPNLITEAMIDDLGLASDKVEEFVEEKGSFLSVGPDFEGVVINLDEFETVKEAEELVEKLKSEGEMIVLCGKQMNLSHDPLISLADGLILENAGIASHGAQRAREQGKGALGGIRIRKLRSLMRFKFAPSSLLVSAIKEDEES